VGNPLLARDAKLDMLIAELAVVRRHLERLLKVLDSKNE
jgi:hypothetical protein